MIVSDAYCHSKYAQKSQEWFMKNSSVLRLDFLSRLKIFDAAVHNIIYFFKKTDNEANKPVRAVHYPEFGNVLCLKTDIQSKLNYRMFFPEDNELSLNGIPLGDICYISKGMVVNADERTAQGEFEMIDLVAEKKDKNHPKPFVEGKHLDKWVPSTHKWLEWGTKRAPAKFSRKTFFEMYDVPEKILVQRSPGPDPKACYDENKLYFTESTVGFILWEYLENVKNNSLKKVARYKSEPPKTGLPKREYLELTSSKFSLKYLLAIMNSSVAHQFLRSNRRSNIHLYPDDWKCLPIPDVDANKQKPIIAIVDKILALKQKDPNADISAFECKINQMVYKLYGLTPEEIAMIDGMK